MTDTMNEQIDSVMKKYITEKKQMLEKGINLHISKSTSHRGRSSPRKKKSSNKKTKCKGSMTEEAFAVKESEAIREKKHTFRHHFLLGKVDMTDLTSLYSVQKSKENVFGRIRLARHRLTGKMVAIRTIVPNAVETKCFDHEDDVKILSRLRHPNIIQFYHSISCSNRQHLVFEYASDGSVLDYLMLKYRDGMPEIEAKGIILQVLVGLAYMHEHDIVHRNIKADNVLLDEGIAKLRDFRLAKHIAPGKFYNSTNGKTCNLSPQAIAGEKHNPCLGDTWSVGVMLYYMLSGKHPFRQETEQETRLAIMFKPLKCPASFSEECRSFLKKLLERDEAERYASDEALLDPWLDMRSLPIVVDHLSLNPKSVKQAAQVLNMDVQVLRSLLLKKVHDYRTTTYYLVNKHLGFS